MSTLIQIGEKQRATHGDRLNYVENTKRFTCRFIEPAVVSYKDSANGKIEYLGRETLDRCVQGLVGCPVTPGHYPAHMGNNDELRFRWLMDNKIGTVDEVHFNPDDGWFWCSGTLEKPEAVSAAENKSLYCSCGYDVEELGEGKTRNNVPYEREITDISFHHLAVVRKKPRYEGATFRFNSLQPTTNMFKWMFRKSATQKKADGTDEIVTQDVTGELPVDSEVDLGDGQKARLNEIIANEERRIKATPEAVTISPEAEFDVGGKKVKLSVMLENERAERLNALAEKKKLDDEAKAKADAEKARLEAEDKTRNNEVQFFKTLATARTAGAIIDTVKKAEPVDYRAEQKRLAHEYFGPPQRA